MFADNDLLDTIWSAAAGALPWVAWGAVALAGAAASVWVAVRLHRSGAISVVAGHVRRLLMARISASPAPPLVEAPEAPEPPAAPKETETPALIVEAPPPPATAPTVGVDEASPRLIQILSGIATVPTMLALPLAAWSVSQSLPVPDAVALPAGVLFDVAMVSSVLIAMLAPRFVRPATTVGWITASLAAAAIAFHAGFSVAALFAASPLVSKLLWGLVVKVRIEQATARKREAARLQREAQEEARKAEELSADLTFEQKEEIARLEREALFEEKLAAAKLKVKLAKSAAEHQEALAEIARIGEQKRAEDEESAKVWAQQIRLSRKLQAMRGEAPSFLAVESSVSEAELVGEVTASGASAKADFGGVGFGFSRPLDVKALTPEGAKVSFEELPDDHQALVRYVRAEKTPTIRGASRKLDRDPRTIRRWKERLTQLGYELPIGE
jgi:hypothetical protein